MLDYEALRNSLSNETIQFTIAIALTASLYRLYKTIWRPAFPDKGASLVTEGGPLFGPSRFWSARWDFFKEWSAKGRSAMSFYVGRYQVINLSGEANRIAFFEDKQMDLGEGYLLLTGGRSDPIADGRPFSQYFADCFKKMLRGDQLVRNFPNLLSDLKKRINALADDPTGITDPFESIYEIVFQLTMRTVGCNEVADNPALVNATMRYNRTMELAGTPMAIMFPWLPSIGVIRKYYAGARMYMIFDKVAKARTAEGRREEDAMQVMLDQGDSVKDILGVVFGSLFAGQLNSGINAAWVLTYLAANPQWQQKVREQIESVVAKHCPNSSLSLIEQLCSLSMSTWETEFSLIDLCLKDSIRLQIVGVLLRRNVSGHTIKVGDTLVPDAAFVTYALADVHHDPEIYRNPGQWDPSRYLPERAEHAKKPYGYLGWGAGKHPCLGMRFAKLEQVLITAFWLVMFDYELVDKDGQPTTRIPRENMNGFSAHKPDPKVYFKYKLRDTK